MKLVELKNRFKNKYVIRIIAGVLVVGLLGNTVTACGGDDKKNEATEATEITEMSEEKQKESDESASLDEMLEESIQMTEREIGKEETVYVIADASGTTQEVIVSDHLINGENKEVLEDVSSLSDIVNVKGDETYTQKDGKLLWQADGEDIFYQGTSEKQTPITEKITYYLDGKEMTPEEIAGKSGRVTIHIAYTNHEKVGEVYVPFAAISGMVLDESFSNIEVTNAKIKTDGSRSVVMGYALPGLKESLQIEEDSDTNIPDYMEISADVKEFELDTIMTMVVNATNYIGTEDELDLSEMEDVIGELESAADQLEEGSGELAEGVTTLKNSLGEFSEGVQKLQTGIKDYTDGASSLNTGIGSLQTGINQLADSAPSLVSGVSALKDGSDQAVSGAGQLIVGFEGNGTAENPGLVSGANSVAAGASEVASGAANLAEGAGSLATGATELCTGVDELVATMSNMGATLDAGKVEAEQGFVTASGMDVATATSVVEGFKVVKEELLNAIVSESTLPGSIAGTYAVIVSNYPQLAGIMQSYGVTNISTVEEAKAAIAVIDTISLSLSNGMGKVDGAKEAIDKVAGQISATDTGDLSKLQQGAASLKDGAVALSDGANALSSGAGAVSTGAATVSGGVQQVYEGTKSLYVGMQSLQGGLTTLNSSTGTLGNGITQLQSGANQLSEGSSKLTANNGTLVDGIGALMIGTNSIVAGVDELNEGSHELADGMIQFNEEGIGKIVNTYDGDVKVLTERLQEVLDAGEAYETYTQVAENVNGSVKFIYKTEGIK